MLKVYRNRLFSSAREAGLDTVLVGTEGADGSFIVRLKAPPIEFEVAHSPKNFHEFRYRYRRFAPGLPYAAPPLRSDSVNRNLTAARLQEIENVAREYWTPSDGYGDIERIDEQFKRWLTREVQPAVAELTTPDLWTQLTSGSEQLDVAEVRSEDAFNEPARELVRLAVSQFRILLVQEFEPDDEKLRSIDEQLKYLSDAVERLNRFDWKALALSTVIGIATTLSLDTTAGRKLWSLFQQAFHAVGHLLAS